MLNVRKWRINDIHIRIRSFVRSRYTMVDVEPGNGLFNYRCHLNAVQFALNNEGYGVVESIYIDDGQPILHYLNVKDGVYIDNTLGFMAKQMEYYVIREIHKSDWPSILTEFNRSYESWDTEFTYWFDKLLFIKKLV